MPDYYNVLGVPPDATPQAIARAFRARAKAVHPDAHPQRPAAERDVLKRRFIALAQAYETLRDPQRRAAYDRTRTAGTAAGSKAGTAAGSKAGTAAGSAAHRASSGPRGAAGRAGDARASRDSPRAGPSHAGARSGGAPGAAAEAAHGGEGVDTLLEELEGLLSRFGLGTRQPFEELLDALLDWARDVFRQVLQAWREEPAGEGAAPEPPPRPTARPAPQGAPPRPARSGPASRDEAALLAELAALKARVRQGGAGPGGASVRGGATRGSAPHGTGFDVEAELRRLKQRLGKA